jgi:hypothetical protein
MGAKMQNENELTVQEVERHFSDAFAAFEKDHPEIAEALAVMGVSFQEYMQALSSMKDSASTTGSASCFPYVR